MAIEGARDGDAPSLVARDRELTVIREAIETTSSGRGGTVVVTGPPGTGKSRLLAETTAIAAAGGARIASGTFRSGELVRPMAPIVDAFAPRPSAGSAPHAELAALADELAREHPDDLPFAPSRLIPVIDALIAVVDELTAAGHLVAVFDDLQWADPASLHSLATLVGRAETIPLLLVLAHRPAATPGPLAGLTRLGGAPGHAVLELGELDRSGARQLAETLTGAAPGPLLESVLERAGGNPLFIVELVRALDEDGRLRAADGIVEVDDDVVPESVGRLVEQRLDLLPPMTTELLRLAAVLGASFVPSDLAIVAGRRMTELLGPLDVATRGGWLHEHGIELRFRHDLVRDAIYDSLPAGVRLALHEEIADALAGAGASATTAAAHYVLSGRLDRPAAVDCLYEAARALTVANPPVAVDYLQRAMANASAQDSLRRAEIAIQLSRAHVWAGDIEAAEALFRAGIDHPLSPDLVRELEGNIAEALFLRGRLDEAAEVFARLGALDDLAEASLRLADLALCRLLAGRSDDAREIGTMALDRARRDQHTRGQCEALGVLGLQASLVGDDDRALRTAAEAVAIADASEGLEGHRDIPLMFLAQVQSFADDSDASLASSRRGLAVARELQMAWDQPIFIATRATELLLRGDWDDAAAEAESVLDLGRDTGVRMMDAYAHAVLVHVGRRRGRLDDALAHVEAGAQVVGDGATQGSDLLLFEQVMTLAATGRIDEAEGLGSMLWHGVAELGVVPRLRQFGPPLHDVATRHAMSDLADRIVADLAASHPRHPPGVRAAASIVAARHHGDPERIGEAVELLTTLGRPPELADAEACQALVEAPHRAPRSRAAARRAIARYQELGAEADIALLTSRLAELGVRFRMPRRPVDRFGWDGLTASEQLVVAGVARGATNGEIADELGISRRTVESHLHHVYTKLGLSSRVQLATEVVRRGDVAPPEPPRPRRPSPT